MPQRVCVMKSWKNFKFDLFGDVWEVRFVKGWIKDEENHWYAGMTYHGSRRIDVCVSDDNDKKRSDDEIGDTLLHEIMHAINSSGQYVQGNYDETCNSEPYVEWVAKCIWSLIKNKKL